MSASFAIATADRVATQVGHDVLAAGGNAADAAIAANAAIAVTAPHMCGMGGDLFALVAWGGEVCCLNASGRAGAGADAAAMRHEGLREMPYRHDVRSVTMPGCVDGWVALHARFASRPLAELLEPAVRLAADGFAASPLLVGAVGGLDDLARLALGELVTQATQPGATVTRPTVAASLRAIGLRGRDAFYGGPFGQGLVALGDGWFVAADLERSQAEWVTPLQAKVWGRTLWTVPPNSQGYLLLGAAGLADAFDLGDPDDPRWAHLLVECATAAGFDRPSVLSDRADGAELLRSIAGRSSMVDPERAGRRPYPTAAGDTTYLCTTDRDGNGVSLIQSNASGFGSWLVEPSTGVNLHNRGIGFSLDAGHPAELRGGARPPHTLCPALATRAGELDTVFGTMGGDAQPQVLLQLAARLFAAEQGAQDALDAGRWALHGASTGFDTWTSAGGPGLSVEGQASPAWFTGLADRGHRVSPRTAWSGEFGHAQAIRRSRDGWDAGADRRAVIGSAMTG